MKVRGIIGLYNESESISEHNIRNLYNVSEVYMQ